MPLGNGDLGVNVWVEKSSSVVILLSKTDAWGEMGSLLKLGQIRIRFAHDAFAATRRFTQRTDLRSGAICIDSVRPDNAVRLRLWADANKPVLWAEIEADKDVEATVELELWRNATASKPVCDETLWNLELYSFPQNQESEPFSRLPDHIVPDEPDRLTWYHRNEESIFDLTLRHQKLDELIGTMPDPLKRRTFGGCVVGDGMVRSGPRALRSRKPFRRLVFGVHVLTALTPDAGSWIEQLRNQISATTCASAADREREREQAWTAHEAWWREFWQRSWIIVRGDDDAERITRCYALQRYLFACGGRGNAPAKFNGSIFNVEGENRYGKFESADYRCWGAMYWLQNTRFLYWPLLACGDFEMMRPLFKMVMEALPLLRHRVRAYFNHGGAILPECMYFWGLYPNASYGREYPGKPRGEVENRYFRNHFEGSLELAVMMVEYFRYTTDKSFLADTLLLFASEVLTFYFEHFPRDEHGRLLLSHINAMESFFDVTNPAQDIAGLAALLDGLLAIEHENASAQRPLWQELRAMVPPIPVTGTGADRKIPVAQVMHDQTPYNVEVPELWTVFPFRAFGVGKDELELARNTYRHRRIRKHECWHHDDLIAAYLGMAEDAGRMLSERFDPDVHTEPAHFPVFWKSQNDWCPDMDHGGVGMLTLQSMLLQSLSDKLVLMPAWPRRWNAHFRLHAPDGIALEGQVQNGDVHWLRCDPAKRRGDVEIAQERPEPTRDAQRSRVLMRP